MDNKLVSIIVPVYNVSGFLENCVESLICQTYENLEIILVDDGSTDESGRICDVYAAQDKRIRVIHKENGGLSSAREAGIHTACGDYVMLVDGDDWIDKETVMTCMCAVADRPDIDCVIFSYAKEYPERSIPMHVMDCDMEMPPELAEDKVYRRLFGLLGEELRHPERMDNIVSCCMKLYRAEIAKKGRYFDNRVVGSAEDTLFNMYALHNCGTVVYLDKCFYHYRKVDSSLTNAYRPNMDKKWNVLFQTMKQIIEEKVLPEKYSRALGNRIALSITGIGMNELGNPDIGAMEKLRRVRAYISSENYRAMCRMIPLTYMPFVWKVFFVCCKLRISSAVYLMLLAMMYLRKK